jgi:hypothetical protein
MAGQIPSKVIPEKLLYVKLIITNIKLPIRKDKMTVMDIHFTIPQFFIKIPNRISDKIVGIG